MSENYEVVKLKNEEFELDVNVDLSNETVWMSIEQISILFKRDKSVISRHIKNILETNELKESATVAKNATVQYEGKRKVERIINYYNLDMIISIGYRVNSKMGTMFRQWANQVLKQYLLKGYVINKNRVNVTTENFNNLLNVVNEMQSTQITFNNDSFTMLIHCSINI